ncbi:MAG: exodeoxyribonuclease VII large subunit [Endomicrobiales bacterium]
MNVDGRKIYTVSELNREIKTVLEEAYPDLWLEGEISNFRLYPSGHMYLTLKDSESQLSAVIFQGVNRSFKFKLEDGLKIIARGRLSTYTKRGEYQLIVSLVEPAGLGALQLAFEQLKARLEKEGLFSPERKKRIPLLPRRIGVVTSPAGAAIRDILSVIGRRFANVEILLYPVRVQGDEAKNDISEAIDYLNEHHPGLDVLLVGRGGGSYEDLWAFNEETVARAIARSRIPVISCVGHEIDFTIADFVADLRAPTPSAAAELVVRDKSELAGRLENLRQSVVKHMSYLLQRYEEKLSYLSKSRAMTRPQEIFEERLQELDRHLETLGELSARILEAKENKFRSLVEKLHLLSPLAILDRGYSICWTLPGAALLKDTGDIRENDRVRVRLSKGEFTGRVEKIQ